MGIKEDVKFLSYLTGVKCKAGDYEQMTRAASRLYVNGSNRMKAIGMSELNNKDDLKQSTKKSLIK